LDVTRRHTDALTHPPLRGIPRFDRDPFSVLYDGPGRREAAAGPDWIHEIKHDGYRLIVRRDGATVRLFTRRGHDRTTAIRRSPRPKAKFRAKSFTIDGDAVVADADGVAVFDALHRRHRAADAVLYAFDLLAAE
jgi:bifunctional non-homologous end joining protein LigD